MKLDEQLFASVRQHAAGAANRFQTANTVLMAAPTSPAVEKIARKPKAKPGGIRFYMADADDQLIEALVTQVLKAGHRCNRSAIVRAGIHLLQRLSQEEFISVMLAEQDACAADADGDETA